MKLKCYGEVDDIRKVDEFTEKLVALGYEAEVIGREVRTVVDGSAETHSTLVDAYGHLPVHLVAQMAD